MKPGGSLTLPIPVQGELKTLIEDAAARTRLSQAEVMRTALRIGVPEVVKRLAVRPASRPRKLLNIRPWPAPDLARAYRNKAVDGDYDIPASTRGQALPGK